MLVGMGARTAREEILAVAQKLAAPTVLMLKAKEGLEANKPYQVGQPGLIGNPAAQNALDGCDALLMVGTDFPYRDSYPAGKTVIQIDNNGEVIGRRTAVTLGSVGDSKLSLDALAPLLESNSDRSHLDAATGKYPAWMTRQLKLAEPGYDSTLIGKVRTLADNPGALIRPEAVAAIVDPHAPTIRFSPPALACPRYGWHATSR
jgi:pyruvate dehydrogenase (quinone)